MKVVKDYPPNIDMLRRVFKLHKGIVFTYGDTLYAPDDDNIDPPLMAHEQVHSKQQGGDPVAWWDRYVSDPRWRVAQELEAYRKQYKKTKSWLRNREAIHRERIRLARDLSGAMYGNAISFEDAFRAIRK